MSYFKYSRIATLRRATPRYAALRRATPRYAALRRATPRYAALRRPTPRYAFHGNKFVKKKKFREFFIFFFGYQCSESNLETACKQLGGLCPLVWEEIVNAQTVLKGLDKLL
jgi:hypothetical protein